MHSRRGSSSRRQRDERTHREVTSRRLSSGTEAYAFARTMATVEVVGDKGDNESPADDKQRGSGDEWEDETIVPDLQVCILSVARAVITGLHVPVGIICFTWIHRI